MNQKIKIEITNAMRQCTLFEAPNGDLVSAGIKCDRMDYTAITNKIIKFLESNGIMADITLSGDDIE
jgi:hypothetical protein